MSHKRVMLVAMVLFVGSGICQAKVDLVTLPSRDTVQLTIYNSADMTLVRESRALTLKRVKTPAILMGEYPHRPDQPGDAAQSQCRQDRDSRAGLSAEGKEPRPVEYRKRRQRQSAGRDYVSDQRPVMAGVLHGNTRGR